MKTLFIVAVLFSVGYLVYRESPDDFQRIKQWVNISGGEEVKVESGGVIEAIESMESMLKIPSISSLKQELEAVKAEREALYELLAKKEAQLAKRSHSDQVLKDTALDDQEPEVITITRRQALMELAERMELQALGLAGK